MRDAHVLGFHCGWVVGGLKRGCYRKSTFSHTEGGLVGSGGVGVFGGIASANIVTGFYPSVDPDICLKGDVSDLR